LGKKIALVSMQTDPDRVFIMLPEHCHRVDDAKLCVIVERVKL
jgi:hypothetical protein